MIRLFSCALVMSSASLCFGEGPGSLEAFTGKYELIGKQPDSGKPYAGEASISFKNGVLKITRSIDGQKTEAIGKKEFITPDKIPVLRIKIEENGKEFEETCMYASDADIYFRITCYKYENSTKKVGLETYFPDHGQLER